MSANLTSVIEKLFSSFNSAGIEFVVLRNYEQLPHSLNSKDVDILVERKTLSKSVDILNKVMKSLGYCSYISNFWKNIYSYKFFDQHLNSIKVDLLINYENRGRVFLTSREILMHARSYKNFNIPSVEHEFITLFFKTLLAGGFINEKYFPKVKKIAIEHSEEIRKILRRFLFQKTSEEVINKILNNDIEGINKKFRVISAQTFLKLFLHNPIELLTNLTLHYLIELHKLLSFNCKKLIVILGPDGVGKTTFIDNLIPKLAQTLKVEPKDIIKFHFRPHILPNLREFFSNKQTNMNIYKPYSEKPANFLSSFLRLTYYTFDYIFGYFVKVLPKFRGQEMVVFDRYFHEFLVDSERSKIKLPLFLRKFFYTFVPKPSLTFVLLAPEEVILKRKSELSISKLEKLIQGYKTVKNYDKNVFFLDTTKPLEETVNEAIQIIVTNFATPICEKCERKF